MAARASWRRLGRVAALVAAAALAPAAAMANGYLSAVDAGAGLLAQGRAREAVRAFEKARGLDLNDPLAAAGLGYALETDGQMAAGRGELLTALDLDPRNSSVLWADALSALNGGRLADAQRRLEPLRSKPELCTPDLWIALAYARLAAGDPDGAGEALKAIEDQGSLAAPQRSVAALVAGAVEYAAGRHGRAVEFLRVAAGNLPPTTFFDRVYTQRVPLLAEARGTGGPAPSLVSASSARSKALRHGAPLPGSLPAVGRALCLLLRRWAVPADHEHHSAALRLEHEAGGQRLPQGAHPW